MLWAYFDASCGLLKRVLGIEGVPSAVAVVHDFEPSWLQVDELAQLIFLLLRCNEGSLIPFPFVKWVSVSFYLSVRKSVLSRSCTRISDISYALLPHILDTLFWGVCYLLACTFCSNYFWGIWSVFRRVKAFLDFLLVAAFKGGFRETCTY